MTHSFWFLNHQLIKVINSFHNNFCVVSTSLMFLYSFNVALSLNSWPSLPSLCSSPARVYSILSNIRKNNLPARAHLSFPLILLISITINPHLNCSCSAYAKLMLLFTSPNITMITASSSASPSSSLFYSNFRDNIEFRFIYYF